MTTAPAAQSKALPTISPFSHQAAFGVLASITVSLLASSSAPTPIYPLYQAAWGFSSITVTVVFGVYALAVLAALLVLGRLSDHIGRRPVLLTALAVQAATMLLFAQAGDVNDLLLARVLQGLATGAALAAVGAALLDLDKTRGAVANAAAPMLGTAAGGIAGGLFVQFLPLPTHLVYLVMFGVFMAQLAGVWRMAETVSRRAGALASLKPSIGLPASVRTPMLMAAPMLVAVWALAGFYGSLAPALVRSMAADQSSLVGGLALFVLAGAGAASVFALRHWNPDRLRNAGAVALIIGVAAITLALQFQSLSLFFVATALAGLGFGMGFQGALRTAITPASAHERASVLSIVLVISYLAMGTPAVAAGYLISHAGSVVLSTAREYGLVLIVLAVAALIAQATVRKSSGRQPVGGGDGGPVVGRTVGRLT